MRAVLVDQSGNVVQAVVLPADWTPQSIDWQPPAGQTVVLDDNAGIGWTYDGKTFTAPPPNTAVPTPLPPDPVVALQAALIAKGVITLADIAAAAATLSNPVIG